MTLYEYAIITYVIFSEWFTIYNQSGLQFIIIMVYNFHNMGALNEQK